MTVAGLVALVALGLAVASLTWLHLQPSGLSPVRNPVSQYGITQYRGGYRVATLAQAATAVALAVGLRDGYEGQDRSLIVVLLVIYAAARAVISWYPMDTPGGARSPTGAAHRLLALLAFGSVTYVAIRLGSALTTAGLRWHTLSGVSSGLGFAMLGSLLGMSLARSNPWVRARFGAVERGFYLLSFAWLATFAVACVVGGG